jgi:hypothetical protein
MKSIFLVYFRDYDTLILINWFELESDAIKYIDGRHNTLSPITPKGFSNDNYYDPDLLSYEEVNRG